MGAYPHPTPPKRDVSARPVSGSCESVAPPNALVAVYETDGRALEAARRVRNLGVDDRSIRVGDSLDQLAPGSMPARLRRSLRRAFGIDRRWEALAAAHGTLLEVPDSEDARRVLLTSGSLRVDVVSAAGAPVANLAALGKTSAQGGLAAGR
jgi:hypothetical protein